MFLYFLYLNYPDFPKLSDEWVRRLLIKQGVYAVGNRKKIFRKHFRNIRHLGHQYWAFDPEVKFTALKSEGEFTSMAETGHLDKISAYRSAEIRYVRNIPLMIFIDGEPVKYKKLLTMTKKRVDSQEIKGKKVANLKLHLQLRYYVGTTAFFSFLLSSR